MTAPGQEQTLSYFKYVDEIWLLEVAIPAARQLRPIFFSCPRNRKVRLFGKQEGYIKTEAKIFRPSRRAGCSVLQTDFEADFLLADRGQLRHGRVDRDGPLVRYPIIGCL